MEMEWMDLVIEILIPINPSLSRVFITMMTQVNTNQEAFNRKSSA